MIEHPNAALLRKGYDAYERGDEETVADLLADDIQWISSGVSPVAGVYNGKEEVFEFFGKKMELSAGTMTETGHDVLANDRYIVGLPKFRAQRNGKTLEANCIQLWKVRDGKFVSCRELFEDQAAWDQFWS